MMWRNWKDWKYEIADKLFNAELDEAYDMGKRVGAEYTVSRIVYGLDINSTKLPMTKTQKSGYDMAVEVVQAQKPEIENKTGAKFWSK